MSTTHTLKMSASVQYIRKLLGKSSCATNNLLNTGHKIQRKTSDCKTTKNKDGKTLTRKVVQTQDKTAEQCIRKSVILRRTENETFGFEIQDLVPCVCFVKEDSLAESSGLMTDDVIIAVNSVSIAEFTQQQLKDLFQKASILMLEIVRSSTEKQRQLLIRLYLLQREFAEKSAELQTLNTEEVRLIGDAMNHIQQPDVLSKGSSAALSERTD
ncbi:cytohesin-interacting protein [Danio rerio]|uniref:Cytohesin-interacting protein n=1 Tax=Danio rerio TaxID=7955 RepID=A0A8M1PYN4_DANRE|nr:cytohesin-interacting protein isoform X2 [Danio rerio]|eukprot:XP_001332231.3 cytohesin-interacting protein isoform X2 [Danio rerio]